VNTRLAISYGLGATPVSLFYNLTPDDSSMESLYKDIVSYSHRDIIFYGDIASNVEKLQWIIPRLTNNLVFTAVVVEGGLLQNLLPQRFIASYSSDSTPHLRDTTSTVALLGSNDAIIVKTNITLLKVISNAITKKEGEAPLLFYNSNFMSEDEILSTNIYNANPYGGNICML
jgi:hypothetical protein